MERIIYVKTNRTARGYARARVTRFVSDKKYCYGFHFYQTCEFFDTYKQLREYVENNYELLQDIIRSGFVGMEEYHLPEDRKEFF